MNRYEQKEWQAIQEEDVPFSLPPGEGWESLKGRAIVNADFSQIELRIAAVVANESHMLAAFREGEDLPR
jgi:hypothetical protein